MQFTVEPGVTVTWNQNIMASGRVGAGVKENL